MKHIRAGELRAIEVKFSSGNFIRTNMAAEITDKEIRDYYRIGLRLNVGRGEHDYFETIEQVNILN